MPMFRSTAPGTPALSWKAWRSTCAGLVRSRWWPATSRRTSGSDLAMLIAGVAERVLPRQRGLVYRNALVPLDGDCLDDLMLAQVVIEAGRD
jgi:hypothetical protein